MNSRICWPIRLLSVSRRSPSEGLAVHNQRQVPGFTDKNEGALLKAADEAGIGPAIRRATSDGIRTGQLVLAKIAAQEEMVRKMKGTSVKDMAERIRAARDEIS